ncbi:hypothetical protein AKJ16_DCAP07955 [Drosera capensis]
MSVFVLSTTWMGRLIAIGGSGSFRFGYRVYARLVDMKCWGLSSACLLEMNCKFSNSSLQFVYDN